jgi:hypothetical protein
LDGVADGESVGCGSDGDPEGFAEGVPVGWRLDGALDGLADGFLVSVNGGKTGGTVSVWGAVGADVTFKSGKTDSVGSVLTGERVGICSMVSTGIKVTSRKLVLLAVIVPGTSPIPSPRSGLFIVVGVCSIMPLLSGMVNTAMVADAVTAMTTEIAMATFSAVETPVANAALAVIATAPVVAEVPADTAASAAINCNILLNL